MASLIMYHQVNQVSTHDKQLVEPALIFIVVTINQYYYKCHI